MRFHTSHATIGALALLLLTGCKKEELPGYYYNVTLTGAIDDCNADSVGYQDEFQYRLEYDGSSVTISIGEDLFATGFAKEGQACSIEYETVVWQDDRDNGTLRWQIFGEADIAFGDSCPSFGSSDWNGQEVVTIISSEDDNIRAGCEYTLTASGKYLKTVDEE